MRGIPLMTVLLVLFASNIAVAQEPKGFKKENLFTGGSISLGFSSNSFQAGASPFLGYSLAPWVDGGVAGNYNYASYRSVFTLNDKLRESTYGGGVFAKFYPLPFLFIHSQFEHNFTTQKFIPSNSGPSEKSKVEANSLLLGLGYASERYPNSGRPFFYISLLFDVLNNEYSPYTRADGGVLPIIRGGVQVPLFQGKGGRK